MVMRNIPLPVQGLLSGYVMLEKKKAIYERGEKYCGRCGNAVSGKFKRCPICGAQLRAKPRYLYRKRFKPMIRPEKYLGNGGEI